MSIATLRPAMPADEPFLRGLFRTTRELLLQALGLTGAQADAFCGMQFEAQAAGYRNSYPQADHLVVLDAAHQPIGRMIRALTRDGIVLVDIALMPAARGHGIGTWLIRGLQQEAARRRVALLLSVEATSAAFALYRRMGFEVVHDDGMHVRMLWKSQQRVEEREGEWIRSSER